MRLYRPSSPASRRSPSRRRFVAAWLAAGAALLAPTGRPLAAQAADQPTVVIVTRHAERAQEPGPDPALSEAGTRRAQALAAALKDAGVSTAIVTQFKRTRLTAAPLAEQLGIPIVERPAAGGGADAYAAALAQELRASHAGKTVLVVGHSNTVPNIVAALSGTQIGAIPDERYGDVYVVTIPRAGTPRLMRMRVDAAPASQGAAATPAATTPAGAMVAGAPPAAAPADVASVDAIIAALYDVISGPPGQARNWDRLRSLFAPSARMQPIVRRPDGSFATVVLTPDDYVARSGERLTRDGFVEREIARRSERFGNLVHVWSTYDGRFTAPGVTTPPVRGINSLQLMHDGTRWWILSLAWEAERPDNQLPAKYLTTP